MNRKLIAITGLALTVAACSGTPDPVAVTQPTPRTIVVEVTPQPTPVPVVTPEPTPDPTPEPTPVPEPPAKKVTVKGKGSRNSKPFNLDGDYTVTVKGRATDLWGGNVIVWLHAKGGSVFEDELLANEIVNDKGDRYTYETQVYGTFGRYYLDLTMPGGNWIVTFTPIAPDGSEA